jgi:hypothetical protein
MIITLDEKISVGAIFEGGRIKPVWFLYKHMKVIIKQVCYRWKEREGENIIYKFTVTDNKSIYEISYSTMTYQWYLLAIDEGSLQC